MQFRVLTTTFGNIHGGVIVEFGFMKLEDKYNQQIITLIICHNEGYESKYSVNLRIIILNKPTVCFPVFISVERSLI